MQLKLKQPYTIAEIAQVIGADLGADMVAQAATKIDCLSGIEEALPGSISFLSNPSYHKYLGSTRASAVVLSAQDAKSCPGVALVSANPRLSMAKLLNFCVEQRPKAVVGVHPSAVLGENVSLGTEVTIHAGVVIGDNCSIGNNTEIKANVTLYDGVKVGDYCIIHSGTVIGSDGFGFAIGADGAWVKMPHLGSVVIGNHVEIGSNTSIDRGMFGDTTIGNHVIIDNLVQIAHNVSIGDKTAIAGCVGIAGSTSVGAHCLIGGAANIAGHLTIVSRVHITGASSVSNSILEPGLYSSGLPARENSLWRRNVARFMSLDSMAKKLRELEKIIKDQVKTD